MATDSAALLIGVACLVGVASLAVIGYRVLQSSRSAREAGVSWGAYMRQARDRSGTSDEDAATRSERSWPVRTARIDVPLVTLLMAALAVRFAWVLAVEPPTWSIYRDSIAYDRMAGWVVKKGVFSMSESAPLVSSAFAMPGFPLLAAVVYAVVGSTTHVGETAVYLAQALMSVAVLYVMYRVALHVYGRRVGLVAVALGAVYWPFVMANNQFLTEVLFMLCVCVLALAALRLLESASWWNAVLVGLLLGLCCLVRPVIVVWGVVPFLLLIRKVPFRRIAALAGVAVLAFALLMTPWWVRNAMVFDRFVPFTTSSANPLLVGTYYDFPGQQGMDGDPFNIIADSSQEELDNNAKWRQLAIERLKEQITNEPGNLLRQRVSLLRTALTWPYDAGVWNVPRWARDIAVWAQTLLMLLGLAGFALGWRSRKSWLLFSMVVYFVAAHAVILILNRYVFPVMPLVILAAAHAGVTAFDGLRLSLRKKRAVAAE